MTVPKDILPLFPDRCTPGRPRSARAWGHTDRLLVACGALALTLAAARGRPRRSGPTGSDQELQEAARSPGWTEMFQMPKLCISSSDLSGGFLLILVGCVQR